MASCVVNIYQVRHCFCINHVFYFLFSDALTSGGGGLADSGETTPPGFSQFLVDKRVASKSIFQIHPSHPLYQAATLRPGSACPNHPWARYQTTGHSCYVLNMLKLLTTLNLLTPPHLFLLEQTVMKPLPTVLPRPVSCRRLPVWILLA